MLFRGGRLDALEVEFGAEGLDGAGVVEDD